MRKVIIILLLGITVVSCNRPEPNYEGVLMTEYGRNGIESFKIVTGAQGPLGPGSSLYQVPMFEQKGDCEEIKILAKDAGKFTIDPIYTYQATRKHGAEIIFNYKQLGAGDDFLDNVEENILNKIVTDTYREEARNYTTDSLMNHLAHYETSVEKVLGDKFKTKHFTLLTLSSGLTPPKSMSDAIEARNNSIQKANQVKNELETSKMEQQKAIIDAETDRIKSAGLTKEVLQEKWINAIRYSKNKIIITDGKTPIIFGN
jgi:regulator of protease activity HflC (stomatin/prohibitin superfamily)